MPKRTMIKPDSKKDALLIVDVQHDFLPGGALEVKEGDAIVPVINKLQEKFDVILATQDFHPSDHQSFAANHPRREIGEQINLHGLSQILWPVHCVQNTRGSDFPENLHQTKWKSIVQKGKNPEVDSYSGFFDNAKRGDTGLDRLLKELGVDRVFVVGLAQDFCVKFTALDSKSLGYETYLVTDATRAVNLGPTDGDDALSEMHSQGIRLIKSTEIY
ncbi:bifunctional nicotinamidase/pyrazinamidase [Algoriphagus namhaensis]